MKRLLVYTKPYWKLLLISLILLLIITVLELLNPYLLKVAIDDKINVLDKPMYELNNSFQENDSAVIFNHVKDLSISFYNRNHIGRLVTRVTNNTEALNEMYTSVIVNLFKDIFTLLGITIIMINYKLAMIVFALLPIIIFISIVFRNKIRVVYRLGKLQIAKINSSLSEYFSAMKTIQLFNKEKR